MSPAAPHCVRLKLPQTVDIGVLDPLRENILAYRDTPVRIDASKVERIGSLGLQLLMSAAATWRQSNVSLRIDDPSDALVSAARTAGALPFLFPEFQD